MSRKRNGWASLVALLILAALLVMILTGCGPRNESDPKPDWRFAKEKVYGDTWGSIYLISDKETGKQWVFVHDGYAGGLVAYE